MVVPPGWNVTEPIGVAIRLYQIADKLKDAPRSTKAFLSKIEGLGASLKVLEQVLQGLGHDGDAPHPAVNFIQLRKEVVALQECVKHCEEFIGSFIPLTATARARWVLSQGKAKDYTRLIESHINGIQLNLSVNAFARAHRPQGSAPGDEPIAPSQHRSETLATLPPYTSQEQGGKQKEWDVKPTTPATPLGSEGTTSLGTGDEQAANDPWLSSSHKERCLIVASPKSSPIISSKRVSSTFSLDASSKSSLESRSLSSTYPSETISTPFGSPFVAQEPPPRDAIERVRQDSLFSLDGFLPGSSLQNLKATSIDLVRKNREPSTKPIEKIESFHGAETNARYVLFSPPRRLNVRYYLNCSASRAVIPHVEHPEALESNDRFQVSLDKIDFRSEQLPSRKKAEVSPILSAAASIRSTSTSDSTNNGIRFTKEDLRVTLHFGVSKDCDYFQELVMGPNVKLQAQIPIWEIKSKNVGGSVKAESKLSCLRLWRRGRFQYLLFHANKSLEKTYKEFRMDRFRVEEVSETSVKLLINLPDPALEQDQSIGLTRPIDVDSLKNLEYLLIKFENNDKANFMEKATVATFTD